MRASLIALLLPALLAVAGCARTEGETLARDWIKPDLQTARAPLYCYSTIGRPDCHANPIAEEEGRLKGYYGPSPMLAATPLAIAPVVVAPVVVAPVVAAPVVVSGPAPMVQPMPVVSVAPAPRRPRVATGAPIPLKAKKRKVSGSPGAHP